MTMFAAFDIEIAKPVGEDGEWRDHRPLGIACAEVMSTDVSMVWDGRFADNKQLPQKTCKQMVNVLLSLYESGITIVSWNGGGFDLDVLAEESGEHKACSFLTKNHVDLMFIVFALKGHLLGLEAASKGMGTGGKRKKVTLSTGEVIEDMDGAKAPELWQQDEFEAVRYYLHGDVKATLKTALALQRNRVLRWISQSGRWNELEIPKLYSVSECLELPLPDTSWMDDPLTREYLIGWIDGG